MISDHKLKMEDIFTATCVWHYNFPNTKLGLFPYILQKERVLLQGRNKFLKKYMHLGVLIFWSFYLYMGTLGPLPSVLIMEVSLFSSVLMV